MATSTRNQFLKTAISQFADRGFYGTSIANIASKLGLTKQALLHHFGSKEKLYAQILVQISEHALESIEATKEIADPAERLEEVIVLRYIDQIQRPDEARLLMRELLDNEQRAERAGNWYLKPYLEELVSLVREAPLTRSLSRPQALTLVYQLLGAANYFAMSGPTLRNMFGAREFKQTEAAFVEQLRRTVRRTLGSEVASGTTG